MKLESKHIVPYLPYGLKVIRPDGRTVLEVIGIQGLTGPLLIHREGMTLTYSGMSGCKPILRPLSDLTNEIFHNDVKFVPLIRLLEKYKRNEFFHNDPLRGSLKNLPVNIIDVKTKSYTDSSIYTVRHAVETPFVGVVVYSFSYEDEFDRFFIKDETRNKILGVGHQLQLFQKLFEWHFDIFGLILAGLAIDVNTLPSKA